MKQETNNEIDLLLRRLSRRQEVPVSDADLRIDSDHLDADELSAYAENALPAAARARYTEHVADCSKCREIVVQLSGSVPVVIPRETVTAVGPSGLRKFLASFFSPMVLRYAVPALGLILVAAIGFVVFRSNRSSAPTVAQLERQVQSPAPNPSSESFLTYNSADAPKESSSPASARPSNAKTVTGAAQEPPPPSAQASSGDFASAKPDASSPRTEQPAVANAAPAQPQSTATAAATVDEMRVEVQGRRNEQAGAAPGRDLGKVKTGAGAQEQKKAEDQQAPRERSPKAASRAASPQGAESGSSTFSVAEEAEKDRTDGVIRSVAGKRFRKQGGVWVDTAYNSGSAISNIARGSERYRSLVADEPEIKEIAGQLDGPFVVVWKGRTYRIQ